MVGDHSCNEPAVVPEAAREIMYSTWYSYHQNVDEKTLFAQAELAKELGCGSLLLDDGWQTEDTGRGYAYCGDWKPAPSKFPDMAGFVKRMHDIGMGVIPWYSVPFIGERSKNFQRFKDMLIDGCGAGVACAGPAVSRGQGVFDRYL